VLGVQYSLPDGSRRKQSPFPNKTAARRWHADNVLPIVNGHRLPAAAADLTLQELVNRYVDRYSKLREPRTIATLKERLARPLADYGDVHLSELDGMADDLATWRATLPPRFAHKIMGALRQVLAAGVRWRLIATNPAADAGPNPEPPPARIRPYTRAELDAIEAELDPRYAPIVPLGAATGLRPQEWSALERPHVDRVRGVVKVEQKNAGGMIVPTLKTAGSRREVPLTRAALAALDRIPPRLDTRLLFTAPEGGPLNLGNFRKRDWNPAVEAAGVERPATPYDLRTRSPRTRCTPA
jgi:integrase